MTNIEFTPPRSMPDEEPFPRVGFLDLPVEIRCQIYQLCLPEEPDYRCKALGPIDLPAPVPPRITRVSREIRIESFECWCDTVRLPIRFRAASWSKSLMGLQGTPTYDSYAPHTSSSFPTSASYYCVLTTGSTIFYAFRTDCSVSSWIWTRRRRRKYSPSSLLLKGNPVGLTHAFGKWTWTQGQKR